MRGEPAGAGVTSTLAVRGAGWTVCGVGVQRAAQTGALLVLARLLAPEDFGLMALAVLMMSFVARVKSLGLLTAFVQYRGDAEAAADTLLLIGCVLTAAALLAILLLSPPLAAWFGAPRAGAVLIAVSLRMVPDLAGSVPSALAMRALRYRRLAAVTVGESLIAAVVSIALAFSGWGVWALVTGLLAGATAAGIAWWAPPMWRPRLRFDLAAAEEIVRTGVRIWSSGSLLFAIDSANRLFVGRYLGVTTLGLYDVASRLVHAPLQSVLGIYDRVVLPAFCREQEDRGRLGDWLVRVTGSFLLVTALASGVLFFFADVLVPVLIGSKWAPVVGPVRALAPYVLLLPLVSMAPAYISRGRVDTLFRFTAARALVTIAALFWASHVSLLAVCAVESVAVAVFAPVNLYLVSRILGLGPGRLARAAAAPACGLAAFAAAALTLRVSGVGAFLGPAAAALLFPLGAAVAFCLAVYGVRPSIVADAKQVLLVVVGRERFG